MTQDEALAILKTGVSVFLTGEPGSGKTHTVQRYAAYLRGHGLDVAITASTGIAATQAGGITIHAWSGIGVRDALTRRDLDTIASNGRLARRIEKASVLVIDEISMLPANTLSLVDAVCRYVRDSSAPFGGLQVVMVGDFFQLPPIQRRGNARGQLAFATEEDAHAQFAYASPAWRDLSPTVCYLTEQYRQQDRAFFDLLSAIRGNRCGPAHRKLLIERRLDGAAPDGCPRLFTHNAAVDRINAEQLAKVKGQARAFAMTATGPQPLVEALKRGCLSPPQLDLKVGAAVMFTRNDPAGRYVNGTLGTVIEFDEETGHPLVRTRSGRQILAEPATWSVEEGGQARASVSQVPLRLAWAITVHKSQGMSLEAAVIDLGQAFEYGQGYVALSRLRGLDGLYLLGLNERALQVHPLAVEQDSSFRAQSQFAQEALATTEPERLAAQHAAFLSERGAKAASPGKAYAVDAVRRTSANAYRPWSSADEAGLKARHAAGQGVDAIAAALGRKPGAIRSRLKKLGLEARR